MMGCTDRHCRLLMRLIAPRALLYTEMVTTGALLHGDADRLLGHDDDAPCALQLGGSHPVQLAVCARLAEAAGYQEINLNVGCPSDRVQQGNIGACLMAEPHLVADCIAAMRREVSVPVTVKTRIGIDDQDSYEFFRHFIEVVSGAGCDTFIVHARKAVLSGLTPRQNREIPPLKYDYVRRVQQDFPHLQFVINGGIKNVDSALTLLQEFPAVMLGRAPYNDLFLLAEIEQRLSEAPQPDRWSVLEAYRRHMQRELSQGTARFKDMGRHLFGYFTGLPGARVFRRVLGERMFREDADLAVLDHALDAAGLSYPVQKTGTEA